MPSDLDDHSKGPSVSAAARVQKFIIGLFGAILMVVQVTFVIILLDRFLYVENAELAMAVTRSGISGGAGGSFGCFGLNSTVLLHDKTANCMSWKKLSIAELHIGDQVAFSNEEGEMSSAEVYFIRDYPSGPLVRIHLASGAAVELTDQHLVHVVAGNEGTARLVPAVDLVPTSDVVLSVSNTGAHAIEPTWVERVEGGLWGPSRLVYTAKGQLIVSGVVCSSWEHPSDAYTSWDAYAMYSLGWHWLLESSFYGKYFDAESAIVDPWVHSLWPMTRHSEEI